LAEMKDEKAPEGQRMEMEVERCGCNLR